jgi:hypothetical protein
MCTDCKKTKVQRIIEGFGNYVFRTPETEAIAKRRAEICAVCLQLAKVKNEFCPECKCFIPAKIRSMAEECPKKLW